MLRDSYGRTIRDLRISVTDRCNFRCFYCLPNGEPPLARRETLLTFEEIAAAAEIFVSLGVEKIRLTGGEPMLRRDIASLIAKLAALKPGLKDLALTTNGFDIPAKAKELRDAGLDRMTISLDTLDTLKFRQITGVERLNEVLSAIEAAHAAGFSPIKLNAVIVRGINDDEIVDLAGFARRIGVEMRFIEYMPLDSAHEWDRTKVVAGSEVLERVDRAFPLVPSAEARGSGTARNYKFADGSPGGIGIIAPVTDMFCGQCSRIRLTADGQIRTCLFSTVEHDLRSVLRSGAGRGDIVQFIREAVLKKEPAHRINEPDFVPASRSMSFIGG
jgi:GTP 3',8-cyclase